MWTFSWSYEFQAVLREVLSFSVVSVDLSELKKDIGHLIHLEQSLVAIVLWF